MYILLCHSILVNPTHQLSMFFISSLDLDTLFAAQDITLLLSYAAYIAIILLHMLKNRGSRKLPTYCLLMTDCFGLIRCLITVAARHNILVWSEADIASLLFLILNTASSTENGFSRIRRSNISQFGTDSRLISTLYSMSTVTSVAVSIAAIYLYYSQQYSDIHLLYRMSELHQWGAVINLFCLLASYVIGKLTYRELTPKKEIKKPFYKSLRTFGKSIAMWIVFELYARVRQSYPPKTWRDIAEIVGVGFSIGTMYFQIASPDIPFLQEPIYEHLLSEKPPLAAADEF
ncbi:unnamed protein product [Umbelopsis ramanniana]